MSKRKDEYRNVTFYDKENTAIKKKFWYGYLLALMCFELTGCADKTAPTETVKTAKETIVYNEETTELNEPATVETSETRDNTTFRYTCWGDDKETVKRCEADVSWLGESNDELNGMVTLFDRSDMFVRYGFDSDGKLVAIAVYPDIDYANKKDLYMRDYYDIKGKLNGLYGDPSFDDSNNYWKETQNDNAEWVTTWQTNSEYILMGPVSHENERWIQITYAEKEFAEQEASETVSNNGIRAEFKEAMDSYEVFFDEYISFMEKYNESANATSMLTDYTNYMTKYADTMNKMSALNNSEMSTAESAYYIEVTTRINKKLIDSIQ